MPTTNRATAATARSSRSLQSIAVDTAERSGLVIAFVALVVWFSLDGTTGDIFTSEANIRQILSNQSVTGLIALSMIMPLVAGYFDLSVAAIAGLSSITTAALVGTHGWPVWISIVGSLLIAATAGAVNGILVAGLKLNGFIVTLGTYILIGGLLSYYTGGQTISQGIPESFGRWGSLTWLGIPRPFWLLIAVGAVVWYVMMHVPFGRYLESIGSNDRGARLVGIRVDRTIFLSFVSSGVLAGIAGVLLTSRSSSADPTSGSAYLFPALAAVFLGATTIRPGRYNVWGTIVAVFFVAIAVNGFTLLGADSWLTPVFNGASLVLAVLVSTLFARRRESLARLGLTRMRDTEATAPATATVAKEPPASPGTGQVAYAPEVAAVDHLPRR